MAKPELRRSLLAKRRSLSLKEWQQKSQQLCHHLNALSIVQQSNTILAYFSFRQEPDLRALFSLDKTWGFPRCVGSSLSWHTLSVPPQIGAYGIVEPHCDSPIVEPDRVDLILVPCVACDRRGYRLGYGGGFYDRLLSAPEWQGKRTIGVVFEFAVVSEFAIDPWDQPLQGICTEREYLAISASLL
ncbi:5-formyltetrahydrofolate cyclo-ligase [Phormidesmis priestleyi ULC007]|uniref:5-formyltetrahydrofolate cyclo-ligase n=2 Tax=Phormidesmis priestleyi TaxID=268141 RepID=A0A2T1DGY5_9CYAN|nr:5-formyltetrahydrofolate cyclo-ligase [Phormidesmis priestleyi]PSB19770.1 5-formyltetrahydrofolate cyclo-ligase [Phormidesmis priestleyi ULC007]PZO53694.1 MAG: 5-formyltetrahydrofolate cyclo-ligase [Phormidesmis priestleyi]